MYAALKNPRKKSESMYKPRERNRETELNRERERGQEKEKGK